MISRDLTSKDEGSVLILGKGHQGRRRKTSRDIRGQILAIEHNGPLTRVRIKTGFGSDWVLLAPDEEITVEHE